MLKLVPFTSQLIPIGNQHHYEGQLVWTDGIVAYGWDYKQGQQTIAIEDNAAGFWVGEESVGYYKLAKKNLLLGKKIHRHSHGQVQCYPTYATIDDLSADEEGFVFCPNGCYIYDGSIVAMGNSGDLLTYRDFLLKFYHVTGQANDSNNHPLWYCNAELVVNNQDFSDYYYIAIDSNNYTIYDLDFIKIAEIVENNNVYTINYNYDGFQYNGNNVDFSIIKKIRLLSYDLNIVDLYQLTNYSGILLAVAAVDGLRLPVETRFGLIEQFVHSVDVRKLFQLAKCNETYLTANTVDRDNDGDIIYTGDYEVLYSMLLDSGTGEIVVQQNSVAIYNAGVEIAHTIGDLLTVSGQYVGHGRITYDNYNHGEWDYCIYLFIDDITGFANLEYNGSYKVLTVPSSGAMIAEETSGGLDYYYGGVLSWQGPGSISVNSMTAIEYTGNYLASSNINGYSVHITNPTGATTVTDGNMYAEKNGGNIKVYENNVKTYDGDGDIVITNPQPYSGNYYSGDYSIQIRDAGSGIIVPQGNDVYVYDNNRNLIAKSESGNVYIYNGSATYVGSGTITTSNLVAIKWFCGYELVAERKGTGTIIKKNQEQMADYSIGWGYTGHSYRIEANNTIVYFKDKIATYDSNNNTVRIETLSGTVIYDGSGTISVSGSDYTISLQKTGFGYVRKDINENIFVYDLNNNLIAKQENREIVVSGVYTGQGQININNVVKDSDNVFVYENNRLVAEENGDNVDVYDSAGQLIYNSYGFIDTTNLVMDRSIKRYKINASGIVDNVNYPAYWNAGVDVELDLSNMDLIIQQQRFTGDPLQLLSGQDFVYAAGVHSWKDFVISQDSKLIWHNQLSEIYQGIEKCFNLSWLKKKW